MSEQKIWNLKFIHAYVGKGRATVAYRVREKAVWADIAWCSPKDQFSRARGRKIAEGRLNLNKFLITPRFSKMMKGEDRLKAQDVLDAIMIVWGDEAPGWARGEPILTAWWKDHANHCLTRKDQPHYHP